MAGIERVQPFSRTLPASCVDAWTRAIHHPFVVATADGSLPPNRFHTWIQQDNRFVEELQRFVRELIAVAPSSDVEGLESGLAALGPELELFRAYAQREQIRLDVAPFSTCREYTQWLRSRVGEGYAPALTAYYGCERSYLEAWSSVRDRAGLAGPYAEWIENWTSEPFHAYVEWLGSRVDEQAAAATEQQNEHLREIFAQTVGYEVAFWDACRSYTAS